MAATEHSLTVPVDFVKRTNGLAIDIGGSLIKIIYRSKENLEEAESNTIGDESHLQLVSFPKTKLMEALEYIQQHAQITRNETEEPPAIVTTGIGWAKLAKTVSETLNIRLKNVSEFDCFVKAFIHLASQLSRKDCLEPRDLEAIRESEAVISEMLASFVAMKELHLTEGLRGLHFNLDDCQQLTKDEECSPDDPLATCEDIFPCILVMCGSGIGHLLITHTQPGLEQYAKRIQIYEHNRKINEDKSFDILELSSRGGRALQGLATLLTGCTNFEEFLELASRGDISKVDLCTNDVLQGAEFTTNAEDSIYTCTKTKHSTSFFCFGKAVGAKRDDFLPEDLAIALLNYVVSDIVQSLSLNVRLHGIRRIFFSGGLCNSALVRTALTQEMARSLIFRNALDSKKVGCTRFDFLKHGGHLGALGAFISGMEKLTEDINGHVSRG